MLPELCLLDKHATGRQNKNTPGLFFWRGGIIKESEERVCVGDIKSQRDALFQL